MKTMKKVLSVILIAVMLLTAAPLSGFVGLEWPEIDLGAVFAPKAEAETEGYFTYIIENGQATITGVTLSVVGDLVIPETIGIDPDYNVTAIGEGVFENCNSLTSISLPEGLEKIGNKAFHNCSNLTDVYFNSTEWHWERIEIGDMNTSLTNATIHFPPKSGSCGENLTWHLDEDGILTISGTGAMQDYTEQNKVPWYVRSEDVSELVIEDGVTSIGNLAFPLLWNCFKVTLPNSLLHIGEYAFFESLYYAELFIPAGVTSIANRAFVKCEAKITVSEDNANFSTDEDGILYNKDKTALLFYPYRQQSTSYTVPDGVEIIGDYAFYDCSALEQINLSDTLTTIGEFAFFGCSISEIHIPVAMQSISPTAFYECPIESFSVAADNSNFSCDENGILFNKSKTTLIQFPSESNIDSYVIPSDVTTIGAYAFSGCRNLYVLTIPESITAIGNNAFASCWCVIYYEGDEVAWSKIEIGAINDDLNDIWIRFTKMYVNDLLCRLSTDGTLTVSGTGPMPDYKSAQETPWYDFYSDIIKIVITEGVTSIGDYAFEGCYYVENVTIADSVERIGKNAFNYNLQSVTFGESSQLRIIDESAFEACDIQTISIPDSVTVLGAHAFDGAGLTNITFGINSRLQHIGEGAFDGCSDLTVIHIPDSVTVIGDEAFAYCHQLESITFGDNSQLESIGFNTFFRCYELKQINFGKNSQLQSIGDNAFEECESLTSVKFGNSNKLKSIGNSAFGGCYALSAITLPDSVTSIGESAFVACGSLTAINIPAGVTSIEKSTFDYCRKLKRVTIGKSSRLTSIGANAFSVCEALTAISIPGSVTSIGESAFSECTALAKVSFGANSRLTSIGANAFRECETLSAISIPGSVTSIGESAFSECTALANISFSVNSCLTSIGDYAFSECISLSELRIPDSLTIIGKYAFSECSDLASVTFGENSQLEYMDNGAFANCSSLTEITITGNNACIAMHAFKFCSSLSTVTIGDGVTNIDFAAFYQNPALTSVSISSSVTYIKMNPFACCDALTDIVVDEENTAYSSENGVLYNKDKTILHTYPAGKTELAFAIPDSVQTIEYCAFYCAAYLTTLNIPLSVTEVYPSAFYGADAITDVFYMGERADWLEIFIGGENENLEYADIHYAEKGGFCGTFLLWDLTDDGTLIISGTGDMADYTNIYRAPWYAHTSKIKKVVIEDGVTSIGDYAFFGCAGFTSIEIADSVTSIGNCAFYECQSLSGISLPENLESIGKSAFYNCKRLTAISIPAKLTDIANDAFIDCKSIAAFTVHEENPVYCSENGVLFNKDKSALVCYPAGKLDTQYSVPDGVFAILDSAFYNCAVLEAITLPESLQSIGEFAFRNCTNLLSLHIPADVTAIGNGAFINTVRLVSLTASIDNTAFCTMDNVLYNKDMTELICCAAEAVPIEFVVPQSVQVIRDFAFDGCATMCAISIGKKLSRVGKSAFATCTYLCVAYYGGSESQWDAIDFGAFNSPLLTAEKHFSGSTTYKGLTAYLEDSFFESDSVNYNHELAKFCALFTVIGYNENYSQPDVVMQKLIDCGFNVDMDNIVNDAGQEEVNHFIAHQEILVDGEWQTLIFAGFIGSYLKQWISNFDPGTGETHKGFTNAKNYVYERLENYIKELGIEKDKTKILLTGHSRGAATCNLVARELISNGKYASPDSIYAYAFATPNSTSLPERKNAEYKRIFNIVNPEDLVTKMIPSAWEYGRYGITYTLPSETNDCLHFLYSTKMHLEYNNMVSDEGYTPFPGGEEPTYKIIHSFTKQVSDINEMYKERFIWAHDKISMQQFITQTLCAYKANPDGSDEQNIAALNIFSTALTPDDNSELITEFAQYLVKYQGIGGFTGGAVMDDYINEAHDARTYCAYMFSLTEEELQRNREAYNGTVNCPVDVEIYNNTTGELVGRIVNNVVDEEIAAKENAVVMSVEGDSKSFWLPSNGDYEVKLIGNDDGTMDYTISEIDSDIGEVKRANFFDVEITDGFTMTADMSSDDFAIEEAELVLEDGATLQPSEIMDEGEITTYTIEITATAGGTAGSSRTVNSGDYVSLTATANDGWTFVGWFENDELISAEADLAFVAKSDRTLTARFEQSAPAFTLGDIDNDGQITSADARSALRAAVGLDTLTETQQKAADVNKDGAVTSTDARSILRCAVGLEAF